MTENPRLPLLDPDPGVSASMYRLADEIVGRLSPAELPDHIVTYLRKIARHGAYQGSFTVAVGSAPDSLIVGDVVITPDGWMRLQLSDSNGAIFWRHTLRGVE